MAGKRSAIHPVWWFGGDFELFQSGWPKVNMGLSEKRVTKSTGQLSLCLFKSVQSGYTPIVMRKIGYSWFISL